MQGMKMTDKQTRPNTIRSLIHSQYYRFAFAFIAGFVVNLTLSQDDNSFEALFTCLIIYFGLPYLVKKEEPTENWPSRKNQWKRVLFHRVTKYLFNRVKGMNPIHPPSKKGASKYSVWVSIQSVVNTGTDPFKVGLSWLDSKSDQAITINENSICATVSQNTGPPFITNISSRLGEKRAWKGPYLHGFTCDPDFPNNPIWIEAE